MSAQLASTILALALQVGGCARGDVVLGELGGAPALAGAGTTAAPATYFDAGATPPHPEANGGSDLPDASVGVRVMTPTMQVTGSSVVEEDASIASPTNDASTPDVNVPSIARPSVGCGKDPVSVDTTLSVNGMPADFLLEVPAPYEPARGYALVLAFRGMDLTAPQFRDQLQLDAVMGSSAIIAYANPVSSGTSWDFQRDMPLVDALISTLGEDYCLDLDRVYALGDSEGGLFVNLVGCVRAQQVRAIAVLSSAPPPPGPCRDNIAVWLMQQSDADPSTVGNGLGNRDFWASRNGCDPYTSMPVSPAGCVAFANCSADLPVRYCEHAGDALPGFAASATWDFFRSL